eukprot:scaffold257253_cov41-Prasinocladus_malaysianus.AAC.1
MLRSSQRFGLGGGELELAHEAHCRPVRGGEGVFVGSEAQNSARLGDDRRQHLHEGAAQALPALGLLQRLGPVHDVLH